MEKKTKFYINQILFPVIKRDVSQLIGVKADFYIDIGGQTICFNYPKIFDNKAILQVIRLEIGALAAWTPSKEKMIEPYIAEFYPNVFELPKTTVLTVSAERTFWEKVTILHQEANRPEKKIMPVRYSRHYYDIYCIANSEIKDIAYHNIALLEQVVNFKIRFYPRTWSKDEEIKIGTIRLCPPDYRIKELKKDYFNMSEMIYGEKPDFESLIECIRVVEKEINSLKSDLTNVV